MTNTLKLKGLFTSNGLTQKDIAKHLGVSAFTLSLKLHNKREFKASEIDKLCSLLHIENVGDIFFANNVELKSTK